jgi:hypothetical protein
MRAAILEKDGGNWDARAMVGWPGGANDQGGETGKRGVAGSWMRGSGMLGHRR